jgi:hypothetical protein
MVSSDIRKKDYVTIKASGTKILEQKRLGSCNIKEMYAPLKSTHPRTKLGL